MADCRRDSGTLQSREISRAKISERLDVAGPGPGPSLPPGAVRAVGPRQLRLKRCDNGYGFTLRHFIVYPPDSLADGLAPPGLALTEPMDTIFVKSVRPNSPADQAGLATGDRIIAVNGQTITRHTYAQVVQLIQQSGPSLALLVVSKEEDLLQRYFGETAHNPETNNRPSPRRLRSPEKNFHFSSSPRRDSRFSEASSCCLLTEPTKPNEVDPRWTGHFSTKDTLFGCSEGSTPPPSLSSSSSSTMTMTTPSMMENNASSKDSLTSSYDSACTLTSAYGGESEDLVLSRLRKSFEQKEEFLRSGWQQQQQQINRGGFYSRPQRFQKPLWPPSNESLANITSTTPPINNVSSNSSGSASASPKRFATSLHRIHENQTVENNDNQDSSIGSNDSSTPSTSRHSAFYTSPTSLQLVSRRAKQFEAAASAAATDDPHEDPRTNFYRSELSRLSTSKRAVPASVAVRRKEFESRSHSAEHPSRQRLTTGTHRESRSLEANEPPGSTRGTINDIPTRRPRSNSVETSWPSSHERRSRPTTHHGAIMARPVLRRTHEVDIEEKKRSPSPLSTTTTTSTSTTTTTSVNSYQSKPQRPTRLELPVVTCTAAAATPADSSAPIVIRRIKAPSSASFSGEEERLVRRVSYLKATWGDRMHVDSDLDLSDSEISRQSPGTSSTSTTDAVAKLDTRESSGITLKEGCLHCKVAILDGKKPPDRSWRQYWASLRGPILFLYKDRRDALQDSPMAVTGGTGGLGSSDDPPYILSSSSSSSTIACSHFDLRGSQIDLAEDYTKRKHVFRVASQASELLFQAEDGSDANDWIHSLRRQAVARKRSTEQQDNASSTDNEERSRSSPLTAHKGIRKLTSFRNRSPTGQSPVNKTRKPSAIHTALANAHAHTSNAITSPKLSSTSTPTTLTTPTTTTTTSTSSASSNVITTSSSSSTISTTKTWKGRMARQLRRIHHGSSGGGGSPSSPTAPRPTSSHAEGATIGVPLEECPPSTSSESVPLLVELCTGIVEARGLDVIGIYRVPGNTAAIATLTEAVNRPGSGSDPFTPAGQHDTRWGDVNVISSLLKSFFRHLPDPLLTHELYPLLIDADKIEDPAKRMLAVRKLIYELPESHFETLKHLMKHLKRIVEHSCTNKMEARNLAIVFGPTLMRTADDNMVAMVTDMSHQCRIVESLLSHVDWFFSAEDSEDATHFPFPLLPTDGAAAAASSCGPTADSDLVANHNLLLNNIHKMEAHLAGLKDSPNKDVSAKDIVSSIISAANRKMHKSRSKSKHASAVPQSPPPVSTAASSSTTSSTAITTSSHSVITTKNSSANISKTSVTNSLPTIPANSVNSLQSEEKSPKIKVSKAHLNLHQNQTSTHHPRQPQDGGRIITYAGLTETTQERIRRFELETKAMLARRNESAPSASSGSGATGDWRHRRLDEEIRAARRDLEAEDALDRLADNPSDASARTNASSSSSDLSSTNTIDRRHSVAPLGNPRQSIGGANADLATRLSSPAAATTAPVVIVRPNAAETRASRSRSVASRGSLLNAVPQQTTTPPPTGTLKRFKTGNEALELRCASLDSLQEALLEQRSELSDEGGDLLASLTSTFDKKLRSLLSPNENSTINVVPSSVTSTTPSTSFTSKNNKNKVSTTITSSTSTSVVSSSSFRDPSLHRRTNNLIEKTSSSTNSSSNLSKSAISSREVEDKEIKSNSKEQQSMTRSAEPVLFQQVVDSVKLKRSESLAERHQENSNLDEANNYVTKLRRSVSLGKPGDVAKLTKNEKTECNLSRRQNDLKRKNGMPQKAIKRRHTVGGTKDFDKTHWLDNRLASRDKENEALQKNKIQLDQHNHQTLVGARTSSPDLNSCCTAVAVVPEADAQSVLAEIKQHVTRPHSMPASEHSTTILSQNPSTASTSTTSAESGTSNNNYSLPLESHV